MNVWRFASSAIGRLLCVVLAVATATGPTAAVRAQQPVETGEESNVQLTPDATVQVVEPPRLQRSPGDTTLLAAPQAGKIDLAYVTPQAVALVSGRPHQVLTSPGAEMLPHEIITAVGEEHLGFQPIDIVEFTLFVEPPSAGGLGYGLMLKFAKSFDVSALKAPLRSHTRPAELAGKPYLQSVDPMRPSFFMPDPTTLLAANEATLRRLVEMKGPPQTSPLLDRVRNVLLNYDLYAAADVATIRPMINPLIGMAVAQQGNKFPQELRPFLDAPNLIKAVELAATLSGRGPSSLIVFGEDEAAAQKLEALFGAGLDRLAVQMKAEMAKTPPNDDPVARAAQQYSERLMTGYLNLFRPVRERSNLIFLRTEGIADPHQQQLANVAIIGILVALLLPAIQAAREAARRNQSLNNLKQIMLSLHNYADAKKTFPAHASYSPDGKPLLSWRVHVLPYLEEQALYQQFHLDEPWDSPHNRALIAQMPAVYANPNLGAEGGKTNYLAVVGPGCVLDGSPKGLGFAQISDGTSKTIVLVEADADQAVEWTKPDDWEFDPNNPQAGIGHLRPGGCNAAWADGSVRFLSNDVDPQMLKALVTRNGREVINLNE